MKKIIALVLVCLLSVSCAFAEGIDYSSMSEDQLREVIVQARAALAEKEEPFNDQCVVFEEDGIRVTITGIRSDDRTGWYYIDVTVVNKSENDATITFDDLYINGWQTKTGSFSVQKVGAGKNAKDQLTFYKLSEEAEITKMEDMQDLSFIIKIVDPSTYKTVTKTEEKTITFSW